MSDLCKRGCTDKDAVRCWPLGTARKGTCSCACHPKAEPFTPSEVALAKILAAWEEWPGKNSEANEEVAAMAAVGSALVSWGFVADDKPTTKGRALLDRARRAGVL